VQALRFGREDGFSLEARAIQIRPETGEKYAYLWVLLRRRRQVLPELSAAVPSVSEGLSSQRPAGDAGRCIGGHA
jgi:hypothetical protein